jgi:predicted TIM-barrel fold metal-dependent hydrolase
VRPILRLETLAEALILEHDTYEAMLESFLFQVSRAQAEGYVALKSIVAYRSGLDVRPVSPADAAAAFAGVKMQAGPSGHIRLASKPLCDALLWHALQIAGEQALPVQFHTGFGDRDADLRLANPLHLRAVIEQVQAPIVLLHAGWPFYREAAHLASIYGHVWLDLSLAIPFATSGIPTMLEDVLGMAPLSKLMFATDAFTMPEIYWLAARWGRWGLGRALETLVDARFLTEEEAWKSARGILGDNARGLYGLGRG